MSDPVTAPRETGGEAERLLGRVVAAWEKGWDCSADPGHEGMTDAISEAEEFLYALATPRPVEVTPEMVEAAVEAELAMNPADESDRLRASDTVMTGAREHYRAILTAALRAQPAGGTPEISDTERIAAIQSTVTATTSGVTIHDATPDWSVVIEYEGDVVGRGATVREALGDLVLQDRIVREALGRRARSAPAPVAGAGGTRDAE